MMSHEKMVSLIRDLTLRVAKLEKAGKNSHLKSVHGKRKPKTQTAVKHKTV